LPGFGIEQKKQFRNDLLQFDKNEQRHFVYNEVFSPVR